MVRYDPTIYDGAAVHYGYGRPAYSPGLEARFGLPRVIFAPGIPDLVRDTESVLSGYFSFSWSAPHLFGDRVEAFAAEVRGLLRARSAEGVFWDWPGDTKVILARK